MTRAELLRVLYDAAIVIPVMFVACAIVGALAAAMSPRGK